MGKQKMMRKKRKSMMRNIEPVIRIFHPKMMMLHYANSEYTIA